MSLFVDLFSGDAPRRRLRIQHIPSRLSTCRVCGHIKQCVAYDHDLRGEVCPDCKEEVKAAENLLLHRGFAIPTDSILEGNA